MSPQLSLCAKLEPFCKILSHHLAIYREPHQICSQTPKFNKIEVKNHIQLVELVHRLVNLKLNKPPIVVVVMPRRKAMQPLLLKGGQKA